MELIALPNTDRERYGKLLLRRDSLKKDAQSYFVGYMREFGPLLVKVYQKEIDCIQIKKTITFCQMQVNAGKKIDLQQMQQFLKTVMEEYHKNLQELMEDSESCKHAEKISPVEQRKSKLLYRKIAKLIHPDLNPHIEEDPQLMDLWNKAVEAYRWSDAEELEKILVLIEDAFAKRNGQQHFDPIPQLTKKINMLEQEIKDILSTDPYQYKFLLENADAMQAEKEELENQYQNYLEYEKELKEIQKQYLQQGVIVPWQEN